jgi:hypothetical protein
MFADWQNKVIPFIVLVADQSKEDLKEWIPINGFPRFDIDGGFSNTRTM